MTRRKPLSRRSQESNKLRHQLRELGLHEDYGGMQEVYEALKDFSIKGIEAELRLPLYEVQRTLVMHLTMDPAIYSTIFLQYEGP